MIPFFSSTFSAPFVTFISEFENTQNSFSCGSPPFGPFWSEKYHTTIFAQKLPIWTAHHIFLESRHPEATENLYCFVHPLEPNIYF